MYNVLELPKGEENSFLHVREKLKEMYPEFVI